jgi:hypothetical protein
MSASDDCDGSGGENSRLLPLPLREDEGGGGGGGGGGGEGIREFSTRVWLDTLGLFDGGVSQLGGTGTDGLRKLGDPPKLGGFVLTGMYRVPYNLECILKTIRLLNQINSRFVVASLFLVKQLLQRDFIK